MTYQSLLHWWISQGSNSSVVTAEMIKPYSRLLLDEEYFFVTEEKKKNLPLEVQNAQDSLGSVASTFVVGSLYLCIPVELFRLREVFFFLLLGKHFPPTKR